MHKIIVHIISSESNLLINTQFIAMIIIVIIIQITNIVKSEDISSAFPRLIIIPEDINEFAKNIISIGNLQIALRNDILSKTLPINNFDTNDNKRRVIGNVKLLPDNSIIDCPKLSFIQLSVVNFLQR